jgi:hypothetical protein
MSVTELIVKQRDEAYTSLAKERADHACTKQAHAAAEAERIALADGFRAVLESQGMDRITAALTVQGIIDNAIVR